MDFASSEKLRVQENNHIHKLEAISNSDYSVKDLKDALLESNRELHKKLYKTNAKATNLDTLQTEIKRIIEKESILSYKNQLKLV